MHTDADPIEEILTRGVSEVIAREHIEKRLRSGEKLRVKLGIDPTSPNLHLGRSIPLLKLRDFQQLGHQVVFIVGDFTAVIGDTSDKDAERPMLTREVIEENQKTYFDQVKTLIDVSKAEFHYNSEWLEPLTYRTIGEHADLFSVSDFIARDNIKRRLETGKRVSLREVLYPLMQGYDSVVVRADVELGGTDQKFNLLAGRTMQEKYGQEPQGIIMNPLIIGLDGRKMSSSWGNTIPLTAPPPDMYGKVMSMNDTHVPEYFELCTRVPLSEVREIKTALGENRMHPKDAKMRLAYEITALYHGKEAAQKAQEHFVNVFQKGGIPEEMPEIAVPKGTKLFEALLSEVPSKTQLRRLLSSGAITDVEGEKLADPNFRIEKPLTVRIGKRRFINIIVVQA